MIHFIVPSAEAWTVRDFLGDRGQALAGRMTVLSYEDVFRATSLPVGAYIWSSLDQLASEGRTRLADIRSQLLASGANVPMLNHPAETLLRYDLLEALATEGLNRHRAIRAAAAPGPLAFPVFVREEHGHDGALTALLHTPRELEAGLALLLSRGFRLKSLLVMEFFDTRDAGGYYRKYAAFVIGKRIIARGLAYGRDWMLKHSGTDFTTAMLEEEFEFVRTNPHEATLRRIADVARVGYGRIDYAVRDNQVETWEINLNPTIHRGRGPRGVPDDIRMLREPTRALWVNGLVAALESLEPGVAGEPIPIAPPAARIPARRMFRTQDPTARWPALRALLKPIKPALTRVVEVFSPLLVRAARIRR